MYDFTFECTDDKPSNEQVKDNNESYEIWYSWQALLSLVHKKVQAPLNLLSLVDKETGKVVKNDD